MADDNNKVKINIDVESNTKGAKEAAEEIKAVGEATKQTTENVKGVASATDEATAGLKNIGGTAADIEKAKDALAGLGDGVQDISVGSVDVAPVDAAKEAIKGLGDAGEEASSKLDQLNQVSDEGIKSLQQSAENLSTGLQDSAKGIDSIVTATGEVSTGLSGLSDDLKSVGESAEGVNRADAAVAALKDTLATISGEGLSLDELTRAKEQLDSLKLSGQATGEEFENLTRIFSEQVNQLDDLNVSGDNFEAIKTSLNGLIDNLSGVQGSVDSVSDASSGLSDNLEDVAAKAAEAREQLEKIKEINEEAGLLGASGDYEAAEKLREEAALLYQEYLNLQKGAEVAGTAVLDLKASTESAQPSFEGLGQAIDEVGLKLAEVRKLNEEAGLLGAEGDFEAAQKLREEAALLYEEYVNLKDAAGAAGEAIAGINESNEGLIESQTEWIESQEEAREATEELGEALEETTEKLDDLGEGFEDNEKSSEKFIDGLDDVKKSTKDNDKTTKGLISRFKGLKKALKFGGVIAALFTGLKGLEKGSKKLSKSVTDLNDDLKVAGNEMSTLGDDAQTLASGIERAVSGLNRWVNPIGKWNEFREAIAEQAESFRKLEKARAEYIERLNTSTAEAKAAQLAINEAVAQERIAESLEKIAELKKQAQKEFDEGLESTKRQFDELERSLELEEKKVAAVEKQILAKIELLELNKVLTPEQADEKRAEVESRVSGFDEKKDDKLLEARLKVLEEERRLLKEKIDIEETLEGKGKGVLDKLEEGGITDKSSEDLFSAINTAQEIADEASEALEKAKTKRGERGRIIQVEPSEELKDNAKAAAENLKAAKKAAKERIVLLRESFKQVGFVLPKFEDITIEDINDGFDALNESAKEVAENREKNNKAWEENTRAIIAITEALKSARDINVINKRTEELENQIDQTNKENAAADKAEAARKKAAKEALQETKRKGEIALEISQELQPSPSLDKLKKELEDALFAFETGDATEKEKADIDNLVKRFVSGVKEIQKTEGRIDLKKDANKENLRELFKELLTKIEPRLEEQDEKIEDKKPVEVKPPPRRPAVKPKKEDEEIEALKQKVAELENWIEEDSQRWLDPELPEQIAKRPEVKDAGFSKGDIANIFDVIADGAITKEETEKFGDLLEKFGKLRDNSLVSDVGFIQSLIDSAETQSAELESAKKRLAELESQDKPETETPEVPAVKPKKEDKPVKVDAEVEDLPITADKVIIEKAKAETVTVNGSEIVQPQLPDAVIQQAPTTPAVEPIVLPPEEDKAANARAIAAAILEAQQTASELEGVAPLLGQYNNINSEITNGIITSVQALANNQKSLQAKVKTLQGQVTNNRK